MKDFKDGDIVLVRTFYDEDWKLSVFSYYDSERKQYHMRDCRVYPQCFLYKGHENCFGCDSYIKE